MAHGNTAKDDGDNPEYLASKGIHSALRLNKVRTAKKDRNKEGWEALLQAPEYRQGQRERYKIGQKFGEAKERDGLRRCRYGGWVGFAIQVFLTAVVLNLKRTEARMRGGVWAMA